MKAEKQSKTVVVLGMHRSGTSMIGGVLQRLGVDMGEELLGKNWSNPLGHYEDKGFLNLNKEILKAAGGSWDNPPTREAILSQQNKFNEEIRKLIEVREKNAQGKPWGWKEPRTSLTVELYLPYLENTYFLVSHRDHQAIAESLKRRNKMEIKEGKSLAEIYEKRIEEFFTDHPELKRLELTYENVTDEPKKWVKEIIDFLELEPTEKQYTQAVEFILPKDEIEKHRRIQIMRRILTKPARIAIKGLREPRKIPGYLAKRIRGIFS